MRHVTSRRVACRGSKSLEDALAKQGKSVPAALLEHTDLRDVVAFAAQQEAARAATPSDGSCDSHASFMLETTWSLSAE